MSFVPARCPFPTCPSRCRVPFTWHHKGRFRRRCDGRLVPRFYCRACRRRFSSQSFRLDYRLRRPTLHLELFFGFVSKLTLRQAARIHRCSKNTVAHRLRLLGEHSRAFHHAQLEGARLAGRFLLDELETFEHNRRLRPLTVPVLVERQSFFVVSTAVAPLPARGGLSQRHRLRKLALEQCEGKRRSGSRGAVKRCLETLRGCSAGPLILESDRKPSYAGLVRQCLGRGARHLRHSSRAPRTVENPLFAINLTLAMLRDGASRLVRRSWAASKKAAWLERHLWIWIVWRNYVRNRTNKTPGVTAAMALGVQRQQLQPAQIFALRIE
ncbi:MAG TPA: hypothetical protein VGQ73_00725 [Gemmatimonadales bacterium]|nr:hypothetical protein [Gemmatimonadales bacterium]